MPFFHSVLHAQTPAIDRLKIRLTIPNLPDTARLNTLISLCTSYLNEVNDKRKVSEFLPELNSLTIKTQSQRGKAYYLLFQNVCNSENENNSVVIENYAPVLKLMEEVADRKGIALTYQNLAQTYYQDGKYQEALDYNLKSIEIKTEINDRFGIAVSYGDLGNNYYMMGDYQKTVNYYFKALKIYEEIHERLGISKIQLNIGIIYSSMGKFDDGLDYMKKSLKTTIEINDQDGFPYVYLNMAELYIEKKDYSNAIECCQKAIAAAEKVQNQVILINSYIDLADIYSAQNESKEALKYYLKAYEGSSETYNNVNYVSATIGLGKCYEKMKDYPEAINFYKKSLQKSKETNYKAGLKLVYNNLSLLNEKLGNYQEALAYDRLLSDVKDSLLSEGSMKQISELNTRYGTEKKEKEILLLTKDKQLKDKSLKEQRLVRTGLIIGLVAFLLLSSLLFNRYRFKQRANLLLEKQKEIIEQKSIQITDSIDYAKTIQEAILPDDEKLNALFSEHFILYKPKAIVSGDFYWVAKKGNKIICAVADCTGHGVPGAFMSLLGHNMLENVIQHDNALNPGEILTALNDEIVTRFSKSKERETVMHGMDIALISMNYEDRILDYAGANNSLYIVRNKELVEIKADKNSTGVVGKDHAKVKFLNNTISLQKGDMLYMFSDGFPDQKGGVAKKKFFYQPFKDLLISIHELPAAEQKQRLDAVIVDWIGEGEQIDDILVMGIRC